MRTFLGNIYSFKAKNCFVQLISTHSSIFYTAYLTVGFEEPAGYPTGHPGQIITIILTYPITHYGQFSLEQSLDWGGNLSILRKPQSTIPYKHINSTE